MVLRTSVKYALFYCPEPLHGEDWELPPALHRLLIDKTSALHTLVISFVFSLFDFYFCLFACLFVCLFFLGGGGEGGVKTILWDRSISHMLLFETLLVQR